MTTGLSYPQGIALDSSGKIYVADDGAHDANPAPIPPSVFVYPRREQRQCRSHLPPSAGATPA